jgi:hypothetical protein
VTPSALLTFAAGRAAQNGPKNDEYSLFQWRPPATNAYNWLYVGKSSTSDCCFRSAIGELGLERGACAPRAAGLAAWWIQIGTI